MLIPVVHGKGGVHSLNEKPFTGGEKRVLIVDDHPIISQGLSQMISEEEGLTVCGVAADINGAMRLIAEVDPNIVVVDISLKNSSGIDLIKTIKTRNPGIPALVYSMHDESVYAERVFRAGARGYVMKDQPADTLIVAIRKILGGSLFFSDAITTRMLTRYMNIGTGEARDPISRLTDRELEVLQLVGQELKSAQIAKRLSITVKTVDAHREHIKKKLDLDDAAGLARFAREWIQNRTE